MAVQLKTYYSKSTFEADLKKLVPSGTSGQYVVRIGIPASNGQILGGNADTYIQCVFENDTSWYCDYYKIAPMSDTSASKMTTTQINNMMSGGIYIYI